MSMAPYAKRMNRVQDVTRDSKADFAFLTPSPNFQYLTGIHYEMRERLIALVITADGPPQIVAPSFEISNLSRLTWVKRFHPWDETDDPYSLVAKIAGPRKAGYSLLFDDSLPMGVYWSLERALGKVTKRTSLTRELDSMRIIKDRNEIAAMKEASRIIDGSVARAMSQAQAGMTELELSQLVINEDVQSRAVPTFTTVQFGENTALPHAESGDRTLHRGDMVLFDCGCSVGGYNTDITRMAVAGEPTSEQENVYSVVLQAEQAALNRISPGLTCSDADGIARRLIEENGYGQYFTHRLGHGVGLQVHEPPYLVKGNALQLKPGMTHSVEPGIYLEGRFGIRIEDLVSVTETGCDALTRSPRELFRMDV
ncbi:MAG: aminopeptidase P family protein [Candidatus Thorarchaeota archaeon]|nr:MAG: aminopeptidase P family protein [Candidatus Thorarchaeota archaeon]